MNKKAYYYAATPIILGGWFTLWAIWPFIDLLRGAVATKQVENAELWYGLNRLVGALPGLSISISLTITLFLIIVPFIFEYFFTKNSK